MTYVFTVTGTGADLARYVSAYLPDNYKVTADYGDHVTVEGQDRYGWTFRDYVEPRLASGLMYCSNLSEITEKGLTASGGPW